MFGFPSCPVSSRACRLKTVWRLWRSWLQGHCCLDFLGIIRIQVCNKICQQEHVRVVRAELGRGGEPSLGCWPGPQVAKNTIGRLMATHCRVRVPVGHAQCVALGPMRAVRSSSRASLPEQKSFSLRGCSCVVVYRGLLLQELVQHLCRQWCAHFQWKKKSSSRLCPGGY